MGPRMDASAYKPRSRRITHVVVDIFRADKLTTTICGHLRVGPPIPVFTDTVGEGCDATLATRPPVVAHVKARGHRLGTNGTGTVWSVRR